jgi:hypothetical protein
MNHVTVPSLPGKHPLILHENFMYSRESVKKNVVYYRCIKYKSGCEGRGKVEDNVFMVTRNRKHNHPANRDDVERRITVGQVKQTITENPSASIGQLYEDVAIKRKHVLGELANATCIPPLNGKSQQNLTHNNNSNS